MENSVIESIENCREELESIKSIISSSPLDRRVQYLTLYSLILCCGTIEFAFKSIIPDYLDPSAQTQVRQFLDNKIRESSSNPSYQNMCTMLAAFDKQWQKDFKIAVGKRSDCEKLKSSINSLVTNRNQFAHGKKPTIGFSTICDYFNDAVQIICLFDSIVK